MIYTKKKVGVIMKKRVLHAACFGVISAFGLVWPVAAQVQHVMQIVGEDGLTSRTVAWLDDRAGTYPVFSYKKKGDTYEKTAFVICWVLRNTT